MHEAVKNLRHKEYNPCGDLTGYERDLCNEATKSYFNLPYVEVMRTISIRAISDLEHQTNFRNERRGAASQFELRHVYAVAGGALQVFRSSAVREPL